MAGRQRGRDVSGWIVIDKPAGPTSTGIVAQVRRAFGARKAGHAGTLDPAATGVLAVALGEATKTVPFVTDAPKTYRFTVRWGSETDTDDAEGRVIATSALRPDREAILAALPAFRGRILQVPPRYSAVKVAGARAYDLARAGAAPELAARPLEVARLELLDVPDPDSALFEMTCGKGGYVRAIARDLGRALGCLGHVAALRRLAAGPFRAEAAVPVERVAALAGTEALDALLLPLEAGLAGLPEVRATDAGAARLRHGNAGEVIAPAGLGFGDVAWASHRGRAVAVGRLGAGVLHPDRVFAAGG
jgi:tRNA pseudouridine55 synthase